MGGDEMKGAIFSRQSEFFAYDQMAKSSLRLDKEESKKKGGDEKNRNDEPLRT
jgi:hypothetical protein